MRLFSFLGLAVIIAFFGILLSVPQIKRRKVFSNHIRLLRLFIILVWIIFFYIPILVFVIFIHLATFPNIILFIPIFGVLTLIFLAEFYPVYSMRYGFLR